jgi:hypothetical protein
MPAAVTQTARAGRRRARKPTSHKGYACGENSNTCEGIAVGAPAAPVKLSWNALESLGEMCNAVQPQLYPLRYY